MRTLLMAVLLTALGCFGQEPAASTSPQALQTQPPGASPSGRATIEVPAGTQVLLALVRPVSTRTTKVGDKVYLQTSAPVVVGDKMAIPVGTSVEGLLDAPPRAHLAQRRGEIRLRHLSLVFANGSTVIVPGTFAVTTNLQESTSTYGDAGNAAPIAGVGVAGGGMAIGALANGARGAALGGIIGGAAGAVIAIALAVHHGGIFMDVGTPVEMRFEAPLTLEQDRVLEAARQPAPQPIRPRPVARTCYDPGSPGTPDTVIPGTPGTPPTVIPGPDGSPPTVIPGTPGTPDTVIPGTPSTPGHSYPCPPNWP